MIDFDGCLDKIKNIAPEVAKEIAAQSKEVQQQLIGLIAQYAQFVTRQEFEKQKLLYERLAHRCHELELQVNSNLVDKSQDS